MVERTSALDGHIHPGISGIESEEGPGVTLELVRDLVLSQITAWPGTLTSVGSAVASALAVDTIPGPGQSVMSGEQAVLRIEPLKWWIVGADAPELGPEIGATLDLSHSRTRIRISGKNATDLLNRFLPLDLRESRFLIGAVASSALHHVGITLWRSEVGYELFLPRGFALSCWEVLEESARQFGLEVRDSGEG